MERFDAATNDSSIEDSRQKSELAFILNYKMPSKIGFTNLISPQPKRVVFGRPIHCTRSSLKLEIFKKIAIKRPNEFDTHFDLGMAATYAKKFSDAVEYFKQAVSLRPDSAPAIYQLAYSYLSAGNRAAALELHARLKEINPEAAEQLLQRINR